jgi:hypothetical protein
MTGDDLKAAQGTDKVNDKGKGEPLVMILVVILIKSFAEVEALRASRGGGARLWCGGRIAVYVRRVF